MERGLPNFFDETNPRFPTRRNSSGAISRRSAELVRKTENYPPRSSQSTPKKISKQVELAVTGKQIKKNERPSSSPGLYARRMSVDASMATKLSSRRFDMRKFNSKSFATQDDVMRLDLTQLTNEEPRRLPETPKSIHSRTVSRLSRASSVQENRRVPHNTYRSDYSSQTTRFDETRDITVSTSRDSVYKTPSCGSPYRYTASTEVDYSSVSPEYSGLSSVEISPKSSRKVSEAASTPYSGTSRTTDSSCFVSWIESNTAERTIQDGADGEWNSFWENYNNSLSKMPILDYYDQCPTPFRDEELQISDPDYSSAQALVRSPIIPENLQSIIQKDGIQLTAKETQNMIKCTHTLGKLLTTAIERNSQSKKSINKNATKLDTPKLTETQDGRPDSDEKGKLLLTAEQIKEYEEKKKTFILELKEKNKPQEVEIKEKEDRSTVTTQTDISLPNTKSAPKIFEKILRQLSRSSIEEASLKDGLDKLNIEDPKVPSID